MTVAQEIFQQSKGVVLNAQQVRVRLVTRSQRSRKKRHLTPAQPAGDDIRLFFEHLFYLMKLLIPIEKKLRPCFGDMDRKGGKMGRLRGAKDQRATGTAKKAESRACG